MFHKDKLVVSLWGNKKDAFAVVLTRKWSLVFIKSISELPSLKEG